MDTTLLLQLLTTLLPLGSSAVLWFLKWLAPRTPKGWIPWLAPPIGAVIELLAQVAGLPSLVGGPWGPAVGALLGAAAVGLREMVDQWRKGNVNPATAAPIGTPKILVPPAS